MSREELIVLVNAFITVRLDYCNSLIYGLPHSQLSRLQKAQNDAAIGLYVVRLDGATYSINCIGCRFTIVFSSNMCY